MPLASLYRTAVHDDRRAVVSHRGHRTAWHILVASGQGYVAIIVLGLEARPEKCERSPETQGTVNSNSSYRRTIVTCVQWMSQGVVENREGAYRFDRIRNYVTAWEPDHERKSKCV